MSQFGMQLPGSQARRGASMNVYTVLLFFTLIVLGAACGYVALQANKLSTDGTPFGQQELDQVKFQSN